MAPHHIPSPIIEISLSAASGSVSPNCYSDPRLNLENWIYDGHRSRVVLSGVARSSALLVTSSTRITTNKEILYLKIGIKSNAYSIKMLTQANF